MQATVVANVSMWSRWQADRRMAFNSWFIEDAAGNLVVDPLSLRDEDFREMEAAGGVSWVVITNRDHEREAASIVYRFGAKVAAGARESDSLSISVDRLLHDGDDIAGWQTILLDGCKTAGEIALYSRDRAAAILGDVAWGNPAGSLRLMPPEKLADPLAAALSLRRVRGMPALDHLLVGDGAPIFGGARAVLSRCIDATAGVAAARVNLDELPLRSFDHPRFNSRSGEIGFLLGAEKIGSRLATLMPGSSFCPMHWHVAEEELFIVWDGTPTLVTPRGELTLRRGDIVAFPVGEGGAHKIRNDGDTVAAIVMVSNFDPNDVCFYPDSRKVMIEPLGLIVRSGPPLDYFDGE